MSQLPALSPSLLIFPLLLPPPPRSTLFPYTTLFRSTSLSAPAAPGQPPARRRCWSGSSTAPPRGRAGGPCAAGRDRKSTRLNSSHLVISYAVFCLKKKNSAEARRPDQQRLRELRPTE